MKTVLGIVAAVLGGILTSTTADATLNVVATTPELAAIAEELGGDRVAVRSITRPLEDPHYVEPRPGYVVWLNRADVLIENGFELELGWLPALVAQTRNPRIQRGAAGHVLAGAGVTPLDVPPAPDRALGHVHAAGNPHYLLDPERGKIAARNIAEGLSRAAPQHAATFRANLQRLLERIDEHTANCQQMFEPYRGAKVVTYHRDFTYFVERFGLRVVNTIEPVPGIPPSAAHMAALIEQIRAEKVRAILVQPWYPRRVAERIARETGVPLVVLPTQLGANAELKTYPELCRQILSRIVQALEECRLP